MAVGAVTIFGAEYRLHYGMTVAEQFTQLVAGVKDGKVVIKKPSTAQALACIIYHAHENWCDVNDEPCDLRKSQVHQFIEEVYSTDNAIAKEQFAKVTEDFMKSKYVEDLIVAGKQAVEESKKKGMSGPILSESPLEL